MLRKIFAGILLSVTAVFPLLSTAAVTKDTTINIIVPRNPGGLQDMAARFIQQGLVKQGYDVVVINKPGGADSIALNQLMDSKNTDDNVYLFSLTHSNLYHPYIFAKPLYNIEGKVRPVMFIDEFALQYFVPKKLNITTIEQLKDFVKNNEVFVGSSSVGSSGHLLSLATFNDYIDNVTFSFYKSDGENMMAMFRGDLTFTLLSTSLAKAQGDKIKDYNPIEMTYPVPIWQGFAASAAMSDEDVAELNRILNIAVSDIEIVGKFQNMGERAPVGGTVEDFQQIIDDTVIAGEKLSTMVQVQ